MWNLNPFDHPVVSMALHPLTMDHWIEIDKKYQFYHEEKIRILDHYHQDVSLSLTGYQRLEELAYEFILNHLVTAHPEFFTLSGTGYLSNRLLGQDVNLYNYRSKLEQAALLLQEDLVLIRDGKIVSGCVCFPSGWNLRDKIGNNMNETHVDVPGYQRIAKGVDGLLERIKSPVWRCNWGLRSSDRLYPLEDDTDNSNSQIYILVEKGSIVPLGSRTAVFSIRVWIEHISCLREQPYQGKMLYGLLDSMEDDLIEYKGLSRLIKPTMQWIEENLG